ncbi:MAG: hypothetical protein U0736_14705 [Gemmataceae bacterium]
MDADYPAAHSMDTVWFAVDADGHVAVFRTGEAGAVPLEAYAGDEAYQTEARLRELLPPGTLLHDVDGRRRPSPRPHKPQAWAGGNVLMALTTLDPVRDEVARGTAVEVAMTRGKGVLFTGLTDARLAELQALPECLGSWNFYADEDDPAGMAGRGFFVYEHLTDNWISGPYGREAVPGRPIHVDQLPPDVRRLVGQFRLDAVRFTDTPHLQPVELTECASWESAYIDVTGRHIRPIPGKEDEYADAYGEMVDMSDEFDIQPPPDEAE